MKLIKLIPIIAFGLFCGIFGWQFGKHCGVEVQVKDKVPTIQEIQKLVGCEKIDGKLCPNWRESETQRKWDKALCAQYAELTEVFYPEVTK